ncbi:MAG: pyridoxamine 5'-phosphate oxidase family protein [Tildeniella nuda ZEHNDER 1965/U140]|nr:pyridoxamine 5'-phosphate oxidase family protein [Tildeniella nuda ZEHNDER 1965/U140]
MATATTNDAQLAKLRELIKEIDFCMLTTLTADGSLHSRPMSTNGQIEPNGDLWFFTYANTPKIVEVDRVEQVNVSFSEPSQQRYVSLAGTAQLVRDRAKMQDLWKPELKAWFPQALDEPEIALLKVTVETAEYWDAPAGWVAKTVGFVKAVTTGEKANGGENEKLNLK